MAQATSSLAAHLSTLSAPATAAALVRMASAAAAWGASCAVSRAAPPGGAAPPGWPDLKAEARAVSAPPRPAPRALSPPAPALSAAIRRQLVPWLHIAPSLPRRPR
jgi:hypothetical protein